MANPCPKCGGNIIQHSMAVSPYKPDGDWYEDRTESCVGCGHVIKNWTTNGSEFASDAYEDELYYYRVDATGATERVSLDALYPTKPGFTEVSSLPPLEPVVLVSVASVSQACLEYFGKHPDKVHSLSPRQFERLIADILREQGFDVELTPATRDGGVDIYAHLRNRTCAFLTLVECKKFAPGNPVGIDVVQRLYGVQHSQRANKSLLVTTSSFTKPAIIQCKSYAPLMELKDYDDLKGWLAEYGSMSRPNKSQ